MGWVSPTGASGDNWSDPENVYDEDTGTLAYCNVDDADLEMTLDSAIDCTKVRFFLYCAWAFSINLDVFYEGAYHEIYSGTPPEDQWVEKTIPAGMKSVSKARISAVNGNKTWFLYEFDFWEVVFVDLAGLTSGVASVSGLTLITRGLFGIAQGVASVSGFTAITRTLAGISSGVASTAADLMNIKWLAGVISGVASVTGLALITRGLAGVTSGVASVVASLINIKWLAGAIAGVATVSADLFHVRVAIRVLAAVRNLPAVRNIPPVR